MTEDVLAVFAGGGVMLAIAAAASRLSDRPGEALGRGAFTLAIGTAVLALADLDIWRRGSGTLRFLAIIGVFTVSYGFTLVVQWSIDRMRGR